MPTVSQSDLFNGTLPDGGPIYTETNLHRLIVEPLNALSAFFFLIIALYWIYRLRGKHREHLFMTICLALLAAGAVGGTVYHGFRFSRFFYLLDVLPIIVTLVALAGYLWWKLLRRPWQALPALLPFFVAPPLLAPMLSRQASISLSYAMFAALVITPLYLVLRRTNYTYSKYIRRSVVFFLVALSFRMADPYCPQSLWMGTHWLWHVFSAFSVAHLTAYLYLLTTSGKLDSLRAPVVS